MDCEESCPLPNIIPDTQNVFNLFGVDVLTLSSGVLFCFVMSTFAGFILFKGIMFQFKVQTPLNVYNIQLVLITDVLKNRSKQKIDKHKYIVAETNNEIMPRSILERVFYQIGKCM